MATCLQTVNLLVRPLSLRLSPTSSTPFWRAFSVLIQTFIFVYVLVFSAVSSVASSRKIGVLPLDSVQSATDDSAAIRDFTCAHLTCRSFTNHSKLETKLKNLPFITKHDKFVRKFSVPMEYHSPSKSRYRVHWGKNKNQYGLESDSKRVEMSVERPDSDSKLSNTVSLNYISNNFVDDDSKKQEERGSINAFDSNYAGAKNFLYKRQRLRHKLWRMGTGEVGAGHLESFKKRQEMRNKLDNADMSSNIQSNTTLEGPSDGFNFKPQSIHSSLTNGGDSFHSETKRFPRSISANTEDAHNLSPQEEHESEVLHFVDKLQKDPEQCQIPGKRIIILQNHKSKPEQFFPKFSEEVKATVNIANTINDILLYTKSSPDTFMDVFFAMTQSVVETGSKVTGCAIAFNLTPKRSASPTSGPLATVSQMAAQDAQSLFPYSYRTRDGEVVVTDLSRLYKPQTTTWFSVHANKSTEGLLKSRNRIYANKTDIGKLNNYNAQWNKTVSVTAEDGYWATPYYDCVLRNWVIQYSVPFYQLDGLTPEFKGVVLLEANFEAIQINQCSEDGSLFSNTHRCIRASTECKYIQSVGFQIGSYKCTCKEGYKFPNPDATDQFFEGKKVEDSYLDYIRNITSSYASDFSCLVMTTQPSSSTPQNAGGEAIVAFDFLARGIPLGVQSFCMTVSLVVGFVIVCLRKTKVMRSSIWVLLEILLFGAILLYATVIIQYFEPTTTSCLLLPWFREVGFAIVYGVLVLKIYRILAEFQSRKAHRVHVRDKDLLKYLAMILIVVIAYMSAWTAVNIDHLNNNSTILERLTTRSERLAYTLCRAMWWDYVIEGGEFIFLCFGIYMCYCVRSASTEYSEGRFITGAICYEAVMSTIFYILKHLWWYKLHPDHLFLMFFLRCQLTVTIVLIIVLGPKLWYAHRPPDEDHCRSRAYSQSDVQDSSSPETMKLNVGISSNGDVEVGEISLTEMDPEDIRAELKRLYTQLQIYKTKTMRKDNPHISKRRGGRKQTHRRFSLQAFHHKHRHQHDHEHDHEMSKTPEESTNSAEAVAFSIEPNVKEDPSEGRSLPSVTFKSGHK